MKNIRFRLSSRGVPHFLVEVDGKDYSMCYFGKGDFIRVFDWNNYNHRIGDIKLFPGESVDIENALRNMIAAQDIPF